MNEPEQEDPEKGGVNYENLIASEKEILRLLRKVSAWVFVVIIYAILLSTDWIWPAKVIQTDAAQLCYVFSKGASKSAPVSALKLYLPYPIGTYDAIQVGQFYVQNERDQLPDRNVVKDTERNPFNSYFLKAGGDFRPNSCATLRGIQVRVVYKKIVIFTPYLEYVPVKIWIEDSKVYDDEDTKNYLWGGRRMALFLLIITLLGLQLLTWPLRVARRTLKQIDNSNSIK